MSMRPVIIAILQHEGTVWTVLHNGAAAGTGTVQFVRDGITGGTRRIIHPLTRELAAILQQPGPDREKLLRVELIAALQWDPRDRFNSDASSAE